VLLRTTCDMGISQLLRRADRHSESRTENYQAAIGPCAADLARHCAAEQLGICLVV
jgi:hypothetical protein